MKLVDIFYREAYKLEAEADALLFNPGHPDVPKKLPAKNLEKRER